MKKIISFMLLMALPFCVSAQFQGPPTQDQIQEFMRQMGAPDGISAPGGMGAPGGEAFMPNFGGGNGGGGDQSGMPAGAQDMMKKGQQMEQQGLNRMKKATSSMNKAVKQMEKTIDKVKKAGYTVSQEIIDATAKGKAAIAAIEAAASIDDAQTALDDFNDFVDILDSNIEPLNMLANFPKILKQATRTLDKLVKNFEKFKAKATQNELDLSSTVSEIQTKIDALRKAYTDAQEFAKAGKAEEAFNELETNYFENIEDVYQSVGMLQAALNLSKAVKQVEKGIAAAEKVVSKLEKKGEDVDAAKGFISQAKTKLGELKVYLKTKDFEPETAVEMLDELNDLRSGFEDSVEEITGKSSGVDFFNMKAPAMPREMQNGFPEGGAGGSGFEKMDFGF